MTTSNIKQLTQQQLHTSDIGMVGVILLNLPSMMMPDDEF